MIALPLLPFIVSLATASVAVQAGDSSLPWPDTSVSAPKDFVVNGFGLGCQRQFIFKRGGVATFDQSWSYSVVGLKEKYLTHPVVLNQTRIALDAPLSLVNASAGHFRGAYRLKEDKDYALLPIQFDGCDRSTPYDKYQIKASKDGVANWYSPTFAVKSFANPDQVLNLRAVRDASDKSKINISWETYSSQSGQKSDRPMGAFIIAGKSGVKDMLFSQYVEDGMMQATIDVGPLPVNVTVVRYDKEGSGGLSPLHNAPQVLVQMVA